VVRGAIVVEAAPPIADTSDEVIHVIPGVLWPLVVLVALILFQEQIRSLLGRLQSARLPGNIQLDFGPALEKASKRIPDSLFGLTPEKVEAIWDRAGRNADAVVGARVLWVDDEPEGNVWELEAMDALGISVTTVRSTEAARFYLEHVPLELVISDMSRPAEDTPVLLAGEQLRDAMHAYGVTAPLIFYVLDLDLSQRPPLRTFAITDRPDELLDYVLDALIVRGGRNGGGRKARREAKQRAVQKPSLTARSTTQRRAGGASSGVGDGT
jgi:CheY-like chemotaxis protein